MQHGALPWSWCLFNSVTVPTVCPRPLRCIPCKGSRYPPTLPRPAVAILPFKLPLCQTATEKGQMEVNPPNVSSSRKRPRRSKPHDLNQSDKEKIQDNCGNVEMSSCVLFQEQFLRSVLFHNHYSFLSSSGYETDEDGQSRSQKEQQELLMKMFAVSVHTRYHDPWFRSRVLIGGFSASSSSCPVSWRGSFAPWSWRSWWLTTWWLWPFGTRPDPDAWPSPSGSATWPWREPTRSRRKSRRSRKRSQSTEASGGTLGNNQSTSVT